MSRPFSTVAWESVAATHREIVDHPFLVSLGDGTLPGEVFERYLRDDAHYLVEYARALALIAARMPTIHGVGTMARCAGDAVLAEGELHRSLLETASRPTVSAPSPACRAYTGFLLMNAATRPVEIGVAAVLPCFRVYAEIGTALVEAVNEREDHDDAQRHPYAAWVQTYADPDFTATVREVEQLADAMLATSPHRGDALAAYACATDHELRFWDQSWRGW